MESLQFEFSPGAADSSAQGLRSAHTLRRSYDLVVILVLVNVKLCVCELNCERHIIPR